MDRAYTCKIVNNSQLKRGQFVWLNNHWTRLYFRHIDEFGREDYNKTDFLVRLKSETYGGNISFYDTNK